MSPRFLAVCHLWCSFIIIELSLKYKRNGLIVSAIGLKFASSLYVVGDVQGAYFVEQQKAVNRHRTPFVTTQKKIILQVV